MVATGALLRVLMIEDSADDALLILRSLRKSGYAPECKRVDSAAAMITALRAKPWDIILSDFLIPGFGGLDALKIAQEHGRDLPFVLLSGKVSEETAVDAMKAGAHDFVMKDRLGRLGSVVERELADAAARRGIRRAEIEWRTAFDSVRDPIFFHDAEYRILRANLAYAKLAGLPFQEIVGKRYWEVFPKLAEPLQGCCAITERRQDWSEEEFSLPGGEAYASRSFAITDDRDGYLYSFHVLQDITERNRVRDSLEKSERHFRKLIEHGADAFFIIDEAGQIKYRSDSGARVTGWDSSSVVGKNIATFLHADDVPAVRAALARVVAKPGATEEFEVRVQHKDGHVISADVQGRNYLDDPDVGGIVVTMRDITERKRATQALLDAENRYRSIFTESRDGIVLVDAATAYVVDCNPEFERQCARPLKELQRLHVWELRPSEMRDASRAKFEEIKAAGHGGSQELPLLRPDGSVLAVEFTSKRLNVAGHDLVQSACRDITERRRAELAQAQSADRLRHSMEGTIQAMAATLEMRDAYTAGHQRRVAELAVAIAHELKFSDNEIHGLHLAAVVHDLGKIQVPAEILSKPTKLSPIEYELVKSHAQAGYDILKTVEFEWPLAQIVYQHHERLDGSGYPRGLKGDEILPGAKILAVADTIEAMYSHRPYRAGLGIDAALAEIVRNRGVKYDASIVDACVKLFRENKFAFSA